MVSRPWRGSSKGMHWLLLAWDDASVEVTGELRLTVAVSVDAGSRIDGEGKDLLQVLLCWRCCWCWQIKYNTWFTLLSHFQLMNRFPPSIHRLYKRLLKCFSPEIVNVSLPPFWGPRISYWSIPIFVFLGMHISTSTIQSQPFFIFFAFYQDLDGVDYLQETAHLEALNTFLNSMNWLYVILVEQTHYICTFSCRLDDTLEKLFLALS